MTLASMMDPAVGASTCASGSQVCSGKIGTLIANAMKNARNSSISVVRGQRQAPALQLGEIAGVIERAGVIVQEDDRDQHQHRSGHRVQEELDRA